MIVSKTFFVVLPFCSANRDCSLSPSRQRPLSVSPIRGQSSLGPSGTSPTPNEANHQETLVDSHGRRMTLSHCENILLSEETTFSRHRSRYHKVLLISFLSLETLIKHGRISAQTTNKGTHMSMHSRHLSSPIYYSLLDYYYISSV